MLPGSLWWDIILLIGNLGAKHNIFKEFVSLAPTLLQSKPPENTCGEQMLWKKSRLVIVDLPAIAQRTDLCST